MSGVNMGAQLASMSQAANGGGGDPKAYPGLFTLFRGSDKALLEDGKDVSIPGMGGFGIGEILQGAGSFLGISTGILGKIFEMFSLDRESFWAGHLGGGTGSDSGMMAEAGAHASHHANMAAGSMASDIYSSSSSESSGGSASSGGGGGGGGSNHVFSSVASAGTSFAGSGAQFMGNVQTGAQVSPDATPGRGNDRGMGAGV